MRKRLWVGVLALLLVACDARPVAPSIPTDQVTGAFGSSGSFTVTSNYGTHTGIRSLDIVAIPFAGDVLRWTYAGKGFQAPINTVTVTLVVPE